MEYVSGRTLDRLIRPRRLRTLEALRYSVQAFDALAAAHAAGIIRRDLKPGIIKVAESRLVKVLDFGLAKLTENIGQDQPIETMGAPSDEEGHLIPSARRVTAQR